MITQVLKRGDTLPYIRAQMSGATGFIDLGTGTVKFIYKCKSRSGESVTGNATVLGAATGLVEYIWGTGDVVTPGTYYGEMRATINSKQVTHPIDSFLIFEIVDGL